MPFALILIGMLAFVAAFRDTLPQLGTLLKGDFSGSRNFFYFLAAFVIIDVFGNLTGLTRSAKAILALVLIGMIISDQGFFAKFVAALNEQAPAPTAVNTAAEGEAAPSSGSSSSAGNDITSQLEQQAIKIAPQILGITL